MNEERTKDIEELLRIVLRNISTPRNPRAFDDVLKRALPNDTFAIDNPSARENNDGFRSALTDLLASTWKDVEEWGAPEQIRMAKIGWEMLQRLQDAAG